MMNQAKWKRSYILQIGIIMAITVGLGFTLYLPTLLQDTPPQSRILQTAPGCKLGQTFCGATAGQQQIQLKIENDEIRSATPLQFEVKLSNIEADQVMLDLKGQAMYMGLNQVMLNKVPGTTDRWQGEATLAVCTTGKMTWISSIIAEHKGNLTQADFFFDAY